MARRGRQAAPHKLPFVRLMPYGYGLKLHWLYAIGLPSGDIKIGMTFKPRDRISQHLSAHGTLEWVHLFCSFPTWRAAKDAEARSIALAAKVGRRRGTTENFGDLRRDQALRLVREAIQAA